MIKLIRQLVLPHFGIDAAEAKITALGNGHINDTRLVRWPAGELVLQRINTEVFKTPSALVSNAIKLVIIYALSRCSNNMALKSLALI